VFRMKTDSILRKGKRGLKSVKSCHNANQLVLIQDRLILSIDYQEVTEKFNDQSKSSKPPYHPDLYESIFNCRIN